jgi:hypothetical protein
MLKQANESFGSKNALADLFNKLKTSGSGGQDLLKAILNLDYASDDLED